MAKRQSTISFDLELLKFARARAKAEFITLAAYINRLIAKDKKAAGR